MRFIDTELPGVKSLYLDPVVDERGYFARIFCPEEFEAAGCPFTAIQVSLSRNKRIHTLRGMHLQPPPFEEAKIVRVVRGSIYDVVVDLRSDSPTYRRWTAAILTADNGEALLIPKGCAHGFLTLQDETDVLYQIDQKHVPNCSRGVRHDDPSIDIAWPEKPAVISPADLTWPLLG